MTSPQNISTPGSPALQAFFRAALEAEDEIKRRRSARMQAEDHPQKEEGEA